MGAFEGMERGSDPGSNKAESAPNAGSLSVLEQPLLIKPAYRYVCPSVVLENAGSI